MSDDVPREIAARYAEEDPTLQTMLERGLPLNRETWKAMAYQGDLPADEDWNGEHEMGVPECFRDPEALPKMKKNYDVK
jgi:hypothetical protein